MNHEYMCIGMKHYGSYKFFIAIITIYQTKSKCSLCLPAVLFFFFAAVHASCRQNTGCKWFEFWLKTNLSYAARLFLFLAVNFLKMDSFFIYFFLHFSSLHIISLLIFIFSLFQCPLHISCFFLSLTAVCLLLAHSSREARRSKYGSFVLGHILL